MDPTPPTCVILASTLETFAFATLWRWMLERARSQGHSALASFILGLTDWVVRPARSLVPSAWTLPLLVLTLCITAQALAPTFPEEPPWRMGLVTVLLQYGAVGLLACLLDGATTPGDRTNPRTIAYEMARVRALYAPEGTPTDPPATRVMVAGIALTVWWTLILVVAFLLLPPLGNPLPTR